MLQVQSMVKVDLDINHFVKPAWNFTILEQKLFYDQKTRAQSEICFFSFFIVLLINRLFAATCNIMIYNQFDFRLQNCQTFMEFDETWYPE